MWYNLGSVSFLARLSLYRMANATRGADVAQLVEQLIRNEQVTGSIPAIGSIKIARPLGLVIFMDFMVGTSQRFAPSALARGSPSLPSAPFLLSDSMFDSVLTNFEKVLVIADKFTIVNCESFRPRIVLNKLLDFCIARDFVIW